MKMTALIQKNYTDIDYALRYTQKNNNTDFGVFVAKESDERYTKEKILRYKIKKEN